MPKPPSPNPPSPFHPIKGTASAECLHLVEERKDLSENNPPLDCIQGSQHVRDRQPSSVLSNHGIPHSSHPSRCRTAFGFM